MNKSILQFRACLNQFWYHNKALCGLNNRKCRFLLFGGLQLQSAHMAGVASHPGYRWAMAVYSCVCFSVCAGRMWESLLILWASLPERPSAIVRPSSSWSYLSITTSHRACLQIPSEWWLEFQHINLGIYSLGKYNSIHSLIH